MNEMSLKAKIRNIAQSKNISAQAVLQNYLMNRFLQRLALSDYRDKFVIKKNDFKRAFTSTANHRGTLEKITDKKKILHLVAESPEMQDRWKNYAKQMPYARDIEFADTIKMLLNLEQILEKNEEYYSD